MPLGGVDYLVTGCADRVLRPLRDDPGADETFEWAGRPHYRGMHSPKPQRELRPMNSTTTPTHTPALA